MNIWGIIAQPFGWLFRLCYTDVLGYAFAIFMFTLIMKAILIPLSVKQKKGTLKQYALKPREDAIRKEYKNDKDKMNKEIMELYQKEGFNPAGGCLPMFLQLPIIMVLYQVIINPLTYILKMPHADINSLAKAVEIGDKFTQIPLYNQILLKADSLKATFPEIMANFREINFGLFGLNLSEVPSITHMSWILIIPIISGLASFLSSKYTMKYTPTGDQNAAGTTKSMMYMMPVMSVVICFSVPAGVGLYWIISTLLGIAVEWALNRKYKPLEILEKARAEAAISNNQKKKIEKAKRQTVKVETEAPRVAGKSGQKPAAKAAVSLPAGKKVSYKFEEDPEIIAAIKAHNAAIDLANGITPEIDDSAETERLEEIQTAEMASEVIGTSADELPTEIPGTEVLEELVEEEK